MKNMMAKRDEKVTAPPKEVPVNDLHLASYLLTLGHSLVRIEGPTHRVVFVFDNVPADVVLSFFREDATVNPRRLLDSLRNLKGLLIQQNRGHR